MPPLTPDSAREPRDRGASAGPGEPAHQAPRSAPPWGPLARTALDAMLARGLAEQGDGHPRAGNPSTESLREHAIAALDARLFAAGLVPTDPQRVQVIATLPAEDFVLLLLFRHLDRERARASLARRVPPLLIKAYRRLGASLEAAETRAMELLENLLVGAFRKNQQPGFWNYEARSSLAAWLAGVALLDWRSQQRAERGRPRSLDQTEATSFAEFVPDPRVVAADRVSEGQELAGLALRALRTALERGEFEAVDIEAFARATLTRRPHLELAGRESVPPSTFSRRKERGAAAVTRVVRAELVRSDLGEERDLAIHEVDGAIRRFCREVVRAARRRRDPTKSKENRR